TWENKLIDGIWTYSLDEVWEGLKLAYKDLKFNIKKLYNDIPTTYSAIGISGMMHGYLPFDKEGNPLVPFRTWRNTITEKAAEELSELFQFNIPQRWSIAHLKHSMQLNEEHVKDIDFFTTLAGYVHWRLTGQKVLGVGEASGMFPINDTTKKFDATMIEKFNAKYNFHLENILPTVLVAGENAGSLTAEGAKLLDEDGDLLSGIPMCPPEGDAGTGMVATNSITQRTGNISMGTSIFSMIVLEKSLSTYYKEVDIVTTPVGDMVAMIHCNNCTSDLNAWINIFREYSECMGMDIDINEIYNKLYNMALLGDKDCSGMLSYCYLSGEHITECEEGRPLFVRNPNSSFNLANFMRTHLFTTLGAIRIGTDLLVNKENIKLEKILGHGGFFKTEGVGQQILATALNVPAEVMQTASEGGAWGIALLASYMKHKDNISLRDFLDNIFNDKFKASVVYPDPEDVAGFNKFMANYKRGVCIEKESIKVI
ncbi:ATPase, partial [Candidatus Epulonipiscium fishelsonii]